MFLIPLLEDTFRYYSPTYGCVFQVVSFPRVVGTFRFTHTCYMPRPSRSSFFDHPNNIGEEYKLLSSSLYSLLHSPFISFLLGSNILLNPLFSNTISLGFSLNVNNRVSHPYKTTDCVIVPYIVIYILVSKRKNTRFYTEFYILFKRI